MNGKSSLGPVPTQLCGHHSIIDITEVTIFYQQNKWSHHGSIQIFENIFPKKTRANLLLPARRVPLEPLGPVIPAHERRRGDKGTQRPDESDLSDHVAHGSTLCVPDGVVESWMAVKRDGTQVEDGRRAAEDVGREPHFAEDAAERPPAEDLSIRTYAGSSFENALFWGKW